MSTLRKSKLMRWSLGGVLAALALSTAACSPKEEKQATSPAATVTPAPSMTPAAPMVEPTMTPEPAPTASPSATPQATPPPE